MSKRNISNTKRAWLWDELSNWRDQAILSPEQVARIQDLYETSGEEAERRKSRAVFTLMAVAALLVGLAALLVIGYNWNIMPRGLKLGIILGVIAATQAGGFYLRYQRKERALSEVVFFLGCLLYGAGIWLVAQIFHLNAHYPDGVWWWALGVLPFALCLDTVLLHALFVGLLALWAGQEVLGYGHLGGWFFGRWQFIPNGAYAVPVLAVPGLQWAYRKGSSATVGLYAPLLAWWVILQPFAWHWEVNPVYFIGSVGALFLLVAQSHRAGSAFAIPYRLYGVLLIGGVLMFLSFYNFNEHLSRYNADASVWLETLVLFGFVAATVVSVWVVKRRYGGETAVPESPTHSLLHRQWLPLGLVLLMVVLSLWNALLPIVWEPEPLLPTILANIAMIACSLWLIGVGLHEDRGLPFAAGVAYFLLWAVLRYIDLFGDFGGMLGAALMFFLCGAVLFGVALYWRRRKEVRHG
jgi:uncharacterized membrane protein